MTTKFTDIGHLLKVSPVTFTHTTGYDRWDELDGIYYDEPSDLSEWEKI